MRTFQDRNTEQWALIRRSDGSNRKLAIFVHGFFGDYLGTWGVLPALLEAHADRSPPFDDWDYLFIGYDTRGVRTYLDIARLICTYWELAATGAHPFRNSYDRLALFGHSLGTLAIRQTLCAWAIQPTGMEGAIHSVTLFGTPLSGSSLASWGRVVGAPIANALTKGNPQLAMLRQWLKGASSRHPWPAARVILGLDDHVVGYQDADFIDWPGDQRTTVMTTFDHREMVKPAAWDASSVVGYVAAGLR